MTITFSTLAILLPAAIMLHVTEEFMFPGGFQEWYARLVPPKTAKGINSGYIVWINALMIGICVLPFYLGNTLPGFSIWYYAVAAAGTNGCFHIWGVAKLKVYSPGVITGTLLYLPLFIIGTLYFLDSGELPIYRMIIGIVAGTGYHVISVIRQGK